jgi:hypothetical protein
MVFRIHFSMVLSFSISQLVDFVSNIYGVGQFYMQFDCFFTDRNIKKRDGIIGQIIHELDTRFDEVNMELFSCMAALNSSNYFASFDAHKVCKCWGNLPRVLWATSYSPKFWI